MEEEPQDEDDRKWKATWTNLNSDGVNYHKEEGRPKVHELDHQSVDMIASQLGLVLVRSEGLQIQPDLRHQTV